MKEKVYYQLSDREIIDLIMKEDKVNLFEIIYYRYNNRVLDKCYSLIKNRNLAEELKQEIFTKVYEKIESFKGHSSFSSWLYAVTYNHCIEYLRRNPLFIVYYPSSISLPVIPADIRNKGIPPPGCTLPPVKYKPFSLLLKLGCLRKAAYLELLLVPYREPL